MKKQINFVVTDLDDTIWDWLHMWYSSFSSYLERIATEFKIDKKLLKKDFKKLHQKYGTTESSYIYNELSSLTETQKESFRSETEIKKSIIHEYYSNKKNNLLLYDGVFETLKKIKEYGSVIVGFTESNSFFTKYRLKHLNLDGVIDCIYAPYDYELPDEIEKVYPDNYWEPKVTEFRYLSRKMKKPDTEILEIIIKDFTANKSKTIYIGDKLDRDISMAIEAGVTSVYAEYGHIIDTKEYDLLREVTHWTDEDVQREIQRKMNYHSKTKPDYVLDKSYSQILDYFSFEMFAKKKTNG